ncbi:CsgG/HfaB family protein [Halodesulfovibrio marinisediminis]|uniref:Curli production assembly/transport component CsgG n=1 Tax=Halodesulfovibrio marinisediminis DSM 17456 TaxID=1121457 RepID=A0A1N6I2Q7_9BACT|nr:CsgG/HfaB family protein [Halodesulfovibrio marinisediminis]SIO26327.1 Curli production assembly/transport component CsgG [Halodesulfovibrio marinisediminis DSM 17456]
MLTIFKKLPHEAIFHSLVTICLVVLIFSVESHAKIVTASATGTAASRDAAIEDALIQAVRQIKGVSLESATVAVRSGKTETTNGKRNTNYKAENATVTGMKSSGVIAGYDILNENKSNGLWNVTLEAQVNVYETPGLSPKTRRKLGIVAFEASTANRKRGVPKILRQKLTDRLVQSRRFTVLDRENEKLYQQEKANWKSEDFAVEEHAKLGMRLGADYIVTGKILSYITTSTKHDIKVTGESYYVERIAALISYKVLVPATMQIKWSSTVTIDKTYERNSATSRGALSARLSEMVAQKINTELLQAIYPIKVIKIAGNQVYLNMGGVNLKNGQYYDVYHLGERLIDPYTKESLGRTETKVATIKVTEVKNKYAVASVQHRSGAISKGNICRPATRIYRSKAKHPVQRKQSSVQHTEGGGVKLPFD